MKFAEPTKLLRKSGMWGTRIFVAKLIFPSWTALLVDSMKAIVGLRPSFSSHVRFGERGAPVFPLLTRL